MSGFDQYLKDGMIKSENIGEPEIRAKAKITDKEYADYVDKEKKAGNTPLSKKQWAIQILKQRSVEEKVNMKNETSAISYIDKFLSEAEEENDLSVAYRAGKRTGTAATKNDDATVKTEKEWFEKFKAASKEDKNELQAKWNAGYKDSNNQGEV